MKPGGRHLYFFRYSLLLGLVLIAFSPCEGGPVPAIDPVIDFGNRRLAFHNLTYAVLPEGMEVRIAVTAFSLGLRKLLTNDRHQLQRPPLRAISEGLLRCNRLGKLLEWRPRASRLRPTESGLEPHKVDLASVVSKYISEAEENLDCISRVAGAANAIVLLDAAEASWAIGGQPTRAPPSRGCSAPGAHPRDVMCQTQTLVALEARCHSFSCRQNYPSACGRELGVLNLI